MIKCTDEMKSFLEADVWFSMSEQSIASKLKWKVTNMVSPSAVLILQIILITREDLRSEYSE